MSSVHTDCVAKLGVQKETSTMIKGLLLAGVVAALVGAPGGVRAESLSCSFDQKVYQKVFPGERPDDTNVVVGVVYFTPPGSHRVDAIPFTVSCPDQSS